MIAGNKGTAPETERYNGEMKMSHAVQICVDASHRIGKLAHRWNYIGYDECNYTHSPGGRALIGKIGRLEKPYYIRTHHMLCTGICHGFYKWGSTNIYTETPDGTPVYDYETVDRIIDIWLENRCIPFFELGFMPKDLADPREAENASAYDASYGSIAEYQLRGWCQPPKDYQKWYELISRLALHLRVRNPEKAEIRDDGLALDFQLPAHGISLLEIRKQPAEI